MRLADLKNPFLPDVIMWRVGSTTKDKSKGMALAYVDARIVMQRLDEVCGPENWQCEYVPMPNGTSCCRLGIKVGGEWVWKSNGGSNITDSQKPEAQEMAVKGDYSDAFKRAAVLWGIGQYLYEIDSPWVTLDVKRDGDMVFINGIAKHEMTRLFKLVGGQSASQLRQDDDPWTGAWTMFQNDLWGCTSVTQIENLYKALRKEGWPATWLKQAADACAERKQQLIEESSDEERAKMPPRDTLKASLNVLGAG